MLEIIKEIVYHVTGTDNLTLETDFVKDLGLNSFDVMNIVCAFEDRFDIEVPTRDVWQLRQVQDVIDYLAERGIEA
ncbi:MAG: acyl carrier protein [Candidatus Limivivens sp.]|nr:acyl carrier protein [Candidatus Limivivens sp.]